MTHLYVINVIETSVCRVLVQQEGVASLDDAKLEAIQAVKVGEYERQMSHSYDAEVVLQGEVGS